MTFHTSKEASGVASKRVLLREASYEEHPLAEEQRGCNYFKSRAGGSSLSPVQLLVELDELVSSSSRWVALSWFFSFLLPCFLLFHLVLCCSSWFSLWSKCCTYSS